MVYVHKIEETDAGQSDNIYIYKRKKNADLVDGLGGLQSG